MMRTLVLVALLVGLPVGSVALADPTVVEVYKSPFCGCCGKWADHLRDNGFTVRTTDVPNTAPVRSEAGVPDTLASCHTAFTGGYFVEGHVPASDVKRLLDERPKVRGIAVPGMPIGSPGMEGPGAEAYDVIAIDRNGKTTVFSHHRP